MVEETSGGCETIKRGRKGGVGVEGDNSSTGKSINRRAGGLENHDYGQ